MESYLRFYSSHQESRHSQRYRGGPNNGLMLNRFYFIANLSPDLHPILIRQLHDAVLAGDGPVPDDTDPPCGCLPLIPLDVLFVPDVLRTPVDSTLRHIHPRPLDIPEIARRDVTRPISRWNVFHFFLRLKLFGFKFMSS
jgi:hypothetical protein